MPGPRFTDIRRFDSIDSTNRYLLDEARGGAPGGWWRWPTTRRPAGAARSPLGGAARFEPLMSVLLRPDLPAGHLHLASAVVALAATDAVAAVTGTGGGDQVAERPLGPDGRKLAGVLAEADVAGRPPDGGRPGAPIVVGIGINVNWPRDDSDLPDELLGSATSLCQQVGTVRRPLRALRALLGALEPRVGRPRSDAGRARQAADFRARCTTLGTPVRVELADDRFEGLATDLTPEGHLVVDGGRRDTDGGRRGRGPCEARRTDPRRPAAVRTRHEYHSPIMRLLVTGGAGFIGSNFVRYWVQHHPDDTVVAFDVLTYAGNRPNLADVEDRIEFVHGDIGDLEVVAKTLAEHEIDVIVNFAAESHNSLAILDPGLFFRTNVLGTQTLLEAARRHGVSRFHHISTCEVYGDLPLDSDEAFTEETPYRPRTPYNASKAGADHAVRAYQRPSGCRPPSPTAATTTAPTSSPRRSSRCSPPRPSTTSPCPCTPRRRTAASGCTSTTTAGPSSWCSSTGRWGRPTTWAAGSRPASRRSPTPSSTPPGGRSR